MEFSINEMKILALLPKRHVILWLYFLKLNN